MYAQSSIHKDWKSYLYGTETPQRVVDRCCAEGICYHRNVLWLSMLQHFSDIILSHVVDSDIVSGTVQNEQKKFRDEVERQRTQHEEEVQKLEAQVAVVQQDLDAKDKELKRVEEELQKLQEQYRQLDGNYKVNHVPQHGMMLYACWCPKRPAFTSLVFVVQAYLNSYLAKEEDWRKRVERAKKEAKALKDDLDAAKGATNAMVRLSFFSAVCKSCISVR